MRYLLFIGLLALSGIGYAQFLEQVAKDIFGFLPSVVDFDNRSKISKDNGNVFFAKQTSENYKMTFDDE